MLRPFEVCFIKVEIIVIQGINGRTGSFRVCLARIDPCSDCIDFLDYVSAKLMGMQIENGSKRNLSGSVDKITFSVCGHRCGYIISHPDLFNPVNFIFIKLAKVNCHKYTS